MNCSICSKNIDAYNEKSNSVSIVLSEIEYRVCSSCASDAGTSQEVESKLKQQLRSLEARIQEVKDQSKIFDSMIMATTQDIQGAEITDYFGIVGAQTVQGINIFKDVFAGVRNVVGGRSETLQNSMKKMREEALAELKEEAFSLGANAVVGISLDFDEYSEGMMMLSISGTAVRIKR